ncbi:MAG: tRNA preQ1(34) S-adenosylmethionine ribosyltransferase-isomerase QueA [Chloroflexota bacterium]|nr:tRNA preQ1(34) S-adenosylmethionine ribosyltransferase-isomerase QueA [Chloroflexota bacterium]
MKTSDFDYYLPPELIAQTPLEPRDRSRLMVIDRSDGSLRHRHFFEIADWLQPGDVLVMNDSRVIPARLSGRKTSGGRVEMLLVRRVSPNVWETLVKPGKRVGIGTRVDITNEAGQNGLVSAEVVGVGEGGIRVVSFSDETKLPQLGKIPLPPYIHTPLANPERYQTVYANEAGSIAAPTAGLHFTTDLIDRIRDRGVHCQFVTLHVELDTFRPVREEDPSKHAIHQEYGVLTQEVADGINQAKAEGRRVICVGTTAARLVEAAAQASRAGRLEPLAGWVELFILPGYRFQAVDALITNFHLPRSTLLMLVSAFAGRELISRAYQEAIAEKYRFYSFGDAMLVL